MTSSIRAIHSLSKKLGLDEDTRRAKMTVITGKSSTKAMTEQERERVVVALKAEVEHQAPNRNSNRVSGRYGKKLQALWIAGYNLGVIRDRRDAALTSWVIDRQTELSAVRFVHHADDGSAVVDALKAWLSRDGGVDWSNAGLRPDSPARAFGYKIARAQWAICGGDPADFWKVVTDLADLDETAGNLTDAEWINVMNALGERVRAAKGGV